MNSIRSRLTVRLAVTMAALSALAGGVLLAYLRHGMIQEFDHSLTVRAYALESLVTEHPYGGYDVDVDPVRLPGYADGKMREFFCITDAAGHVVARSTRQPVDFAGPAAEGVPSDGRLPNGTRVRAMRMTFVPQIEMDEKAETPVPPPPGGRRPLTVVAARDRGPLDTQIGWVAAAVAGAMVVLSLAEVGATIWTVGSGLRTLRRVAGRLATADDGRPGVGFDPSAVPSELRPVVERFNAMVVRIGETLTRERRFSADVAHELRTPIAELRSAAEVALRAPENVDLSRRAVAQAGDIARQMQTLVTTLLAIVRQESPGPVVTPAAVSLAGLLDQTVARMAATGCPVRVDDRTEEDATVWADKTLVRAVLDNVIGNAVEHGTGPAVVDIERQHASVLLTVQNPHQGLTPTDLQHIFEPFWRKDAARSGDQHLGLGLTLTRAYCRAMGVGLAVTLPAAGQFRVELAFRTVPPTAAGVPESDVASVALR